MKAKALVTGAGGLIGSACIQTLCEEGWDVIGVDNDGRSAFSVLVAAPRKPSNGCCLPSGTTVISRLDIRNRQKLRDLFESERPGFIFHTAGQPSHDLAASIPYDDFDVNAVGTLNLLVAARDFSRDSPFCFTSTNKVYGLLTRRRRMTVFVSSMS